MLTKEGRLRFLEAIKGLWASAWPKWSVPILYLVTQDEAESQTLTYSTFAAWDKQSVATTAATPFTTSAADVSGVPTLSGNSITWTNATGGSKTVYGFAFIFQTSATNYLYSYLRFATSTIVPNGSTFTFTPSFDHPIVP